MKGLSGKVAIVTGGGGAIGRAVCLRLAEEGCRVGVFDRDAPAAEQTEKEVAGRSGRARAVAVDITDYQAVRAAVASFEQEVGPTDILVNNAGWDRVARFLETEPAFWDQLISINLKGPLHMHHAVVPGMVQRKRGAVINVASDAGRVGSSGEAVYSACKGGIIAFTKSLAREVASAGVTVNAVCPGPVDTPLLRSFLEEGEYGRRIHEGLQKAIPFRRFARPEDICGAIAFLVQMGLVNAVVPHDQLDAELDRWCAELLERSPTALAIAKRSFNADTESLRGVGGLGLQAVDLFYGTEEAKEGVEAFKAKRAPDFRRFRR